MFLPFSPGGVYFLTYLDLLFSLAEGQFTFSTPYFFNSGGPKSEKSIYFSYIHALGRPGRRGVPGGVPGPPLGSRAPSRGPRQASQGSRWVPWGLREARKFFLRSWVTTLNRLGLRALGRPGRRGVPGGVPGGPQGSRAPSLGPREASQGSPWVPRGLREVRKFFSGVRVT